MRDVVDGGKKTVLFATAVGVGFLVGLGTILSGTTIYYCFIRKKLHEISLLQRKLGNELETLKKEIVELKNTKAVTGQKSSLKKKTVKFVGGYETAEDEEFITASSSDISEEDEYRDLARRVAGSENLLNGIGAGDTKICKRRRNEQDIFFEQIDTLLEGDGDRQQEAYERLKKNETKFENCCAFWWRLAKATQMKGTAAGNVGDKELKKTCAEKALELNAESADVHKWYAITLGSKGDFVGTNEKIQNGYKFKEHIDKAIQLKGNDATLHYLLGRFCYGVSELSWIERQVASTIFSAPPSSSFQESLSHFERAEQIGKPFKENRLFIAKCYVGLGDYSNAAHWLSLAANLPIISPSDEAATDEINTLLQKYKSYLN